jgi:hypothetical protein
MDHLIIELRGQRVPLTAAPTVRGWLAYQGGDYFEFRCSGERWQLSQSAEWDYHNCANVVGRGATLSAAAADFARSITRSTHARSGAPAATRGRDLVTAPIEVLMTALGVATRLGYDDGRAGNAARRGNAIALAIGLACWSGLQQLQLREAYLAGRQHAATERGRSVGGRPVRQPGAHGRRYRTSTHPRASAR